MPVGYSELPHLLPVAGVRLASAVAGIRYTDRDDLVLIELARGSSCAAVFTRNAFCAAPVSVAREHLAQNRPGFLLINSGNANAGTGHQGLEDARHCCSAVAGRVGCAASAVLPFSTGVIGERLPTEKIEQAVQAMPDRLTDTGWRAAAQAIMTTDTVAKGVSLQTEIGGQTVTITGIAKGAGMIRPDMATMLAFVATDARVEQACLQACLQQAVARSFNRITVDGDTSTNDACVLIATNTVDMPVVDAKSPDAGKLVQAVTEACERLAQLIVRDGEGATKFVTIRVDGGKDTDECLRVAYTVAHSLLVKTALFASDANWGRILAAVGRAGIAHLDIESVSLYLDEVCIVRGGGVAAEYTEQQGQAILAQEEITIRVDLGRGAASETVWTCDLSHDYVTINAEYRT